ncbi:MAG: glycosyltransferase [Patescibacteria group bacterium]|nr:glycosyltransferase [Patescibacteria group bacterium]
MAKTNRKIKFNILAYNFPPVGRSGSLRNLFYSDYFSKKGWEVKVFCPKNPHSQYYTIDQSLNSKIPKKITVKRFELINTSCYLNYIPYRILHIMPDAHPSWQKQATKNACEIGDCDALLVSIPPASSLLGLEKIIQKNKPKIVIADFRDPWTSLLLREKGGNFVRKKMVKHWVKKEKEILAKVDFILVTSELQKKWLLKDFSNINKNKVFVVYNGVFNPKRKTKKRKDNKIKIIYTGGFAASQGLDFLFDLMPKLNNIEFHFAGAVHNAAMARIDKIKNAFFHGYLPREKLFKLKEKMDFGIAALTEEYKYAVPAKIFEYLECNLPVLGILPKDGAAAQIIKKDKIGKLINTNNQLEKNLTQFLNKINKKEIELYRKNVIKAKEKYSRENQAKIIQSLILKNIK